MNTAGIMVLEVTSGQSQSQSRSIRQERNAVRLLSSLSFSLSILLLLFQCRYVVTVSAFVSPSAGSTRAAVAAAMGRVKMGDSRTLRRSMHLQSSTGSNGSNGYNYSNGYSNNNSFGSDDIPDEATLRRAYDSWREYYGRRSTSRQVPLEFDSIRYHHFKDNYIALKRANYRAAQKALGEGRTPPPPMQLNEYGDCSADEYKRLTQTSTSSTPSTTSSTTNTYSTPSNTGNGASTAASTNIYSSSISTPPQNNNTYTLTPPPTSAPWAGTSSVSSSSSQSSSPTASTPSSYTYTSTYTSGGDSRRQGSTYNTNGVSSGDGDSGMNNNNDSNNYNKMDPSSAYQQMSSDGMYSYNPPSSDSAAASQPLSSSSFANTNNPSRTTGLEAYAERYRPSDSTNTGWDTMSGNSGEFSSMGTPSNNNGIGNGATSPNASNNPISNIDGAYSYSSSLPTTTPSSSGITNGDYLYSTNGSGGGGGGYSYPSTSSGGVGSASSYMAPPSNNNNNGYPYSSSSSSYMPPSSTQYNGNYDPSLTNHNNGYMNLVPPPLPSPPPPPSLTKDELDAVERARKRQSQIPKGVFDDDFSEDENVDNAWADYGMTPKPKHRREKVDYGQPIINGVANGGSVPVGATNQPSYNGNTNNNNNDNNYYSGTYSGIGAGKVESILPSTTLSSSSSSLTNGASSYSSGVYSTEQDRVRAAYQEWCNHYGKTYDERRLPIFKENYLAMETYCRQADTPLKQLNEFADLSQEEYKKVRPPKKSNVPDWMLETPESKIESKEEFLTFGPRWGKEPPPGAAALLNKDAIDPLTGAKRDFQGEKRIRLAYQEWCNRNGKRFEESRLPAFTRNFVAMEQFCMTQNIPVKPLNEFADLTAAEYDVALREKQAKGETMPSFGSADASMPPSMGGMYSSSSSSPPQQQQQQQQQQEQYQQQYSYSSQAPPPQQQYNTNPPQYNTNNGYSQSVQSSMGMASQPPPPSQYGGYAGPGAVTGSGMPPPQYSSGQMPPIGLTPPPPQQGYGSANAPGVPTGGTIPPVNIATNSYRGSDVGPSTNTIPTTVRPSNTPSKTEAQFKADAEARLKAFAAAKQKRKEEGEARLKRFADLKKQAKALAGLKNITLEEATRQVFANATAELQREHDVILEKVNATSATTIPATKTAKISSNTSFIASRTRTSPTNSSASLAVALTTEEEQILKALAAVKLLSKSGEGNNKPSTPRPQPRPVAVITANDPPPPAKPETLPKSTKIPTTTTTATSETRDKDTTTDAAAKVAEGPSGKNITVTKVATVEGGPPTAAVETKPPSRQRAIVDLSAVLQIEKDAFSKDSKVRTKNKNITTTDNHAAKRRSDVHAKHNNVTTIQGSRSTTVSNFTKSTKVSNITKAAIAVAAQETKPVVDNDKGVGSDDIETLPQAESLARKAADDKARLEEEAAIRAEKEAETAMRLEAEAKERAIEEAKLKAQMKAIQAKVKAFEKARIKAEREAKDKALEAQRLKEEVAARHLAAEAARKKADEEELKRKNEEERRDKTDATVVAAEAAAGSLEETNEDDAAQVFAVQVGTTSSSTTKGNESVSDTSRSQDGIEEETKETAHNKVE